MTFEKLLCVFIVIATGLAIYTGVYGFSTMLRFPPSPQKEFVHDRPALAVFKRNAVLSNLFRRRSVRTFTPDAIDEKTLTLLARAAMAAPTAKNMQPWQIYAVTDRATLDKLAAAKPQVKNAPAILVICGDRDRFISGEGELFWMQDCAAATQNVLLAAEALKLGGCWLGVCPIAKTMRGVSEALSLPGNVIPFSMVMIGRPTGTETPKNKWLPERFSFIGELAK